MIPIGETIVETKKCRLSGQEFFVTDKDLEFYDKVSPVFGGKKYPIPSPNLCPDKRMKNMMCFRNQGKLHKRKDSSDGKEIISIYSEDSPYPVYNQSYWWGDTWEPKKYASEFEDSLSFFEAFFQLKKRLPRPHANIKNSENCEYTNYMIDSRDCYLAFASPWSEKTLYSSWVAHGYSAVDCTGSNNARDVYEVVESDNCESAGFCLHSEDCSDIWFSYGLTNCHNCIFCSNLQSKNFHIFNKPINEEEYRIVLKKILGNFNETKEQYQIFLRDKTIRRATQNIGSEDVSGEYLRSCSHCFHCYQQHGAEECKYCWGGFPGQKNCMDCSGSAGELCYFSGLPFQSYMVSFSEACAFSKNSYYCDLCAGVSDCFGCVGLHSHEHHCVMNKPYSVQEYEELAGKIIDHMRSTGEWGEFFPHELSPFGYNETVAQEYFPMTESEVKEKGWNWYNEPPKTFEEGTTLIPLPISQYDEKEVGYDTAQKNIDALLNGVIQCEVTKKPFKIIKQELVFYIEHHLPIPTKHPDQRHKERMDLRNPRTLYERTCSECHKPITTTYSPERPERVVCEECYRKLVY